MTRTNAEATEDQDGDGKMQVVILAGGPGTRLGSLTQHRPKSMVEVHGKPKLTEAMQKMGLRWEQFHLDFDGAKILVNT